MGKLSSYSHVTSLTGTELVPIVVAPGVAGGNAYITADELAAAIPLAERYASAHVADAATYGNNSTDATTHLQSLFTAAATGHGVVVVPPGTYLTTTALTIPAGVRVVGASRSLSVIKRNHSGNLISSMGSYSGLDTICLNGNSAGFPTTGKGVVISTGLSQSCTNVVMTGFPEPCLEFAANTGSGFVWMGGEAYTTATVLTAAAIKINGTDSASVPRQFWGLTGGGCTLFDFGGGNDIFVGGGYSVGLIFGANSHGVQIVNLRVGGVGTSTIKGQEHIIQALFAGPVILDTTCIGSTLTDSRVAAWDITDNGTGNFFTISKGWTPTWGATTAPVLGNGRLRATVQRDGGRAHVSIDLKAGSTTTFGTAEWYFNLPFPPYLSQRNVGTVMVIDASTGDRFDGIAATNDAGVLILLYVITDTAKGYVTPTFPMTWTTNDELVIDFSYITA